MRGPTPPTVTLSERRRGVLEHLARRHTSSQRLVRRLQIVLAAAGGGNNEAIARAGGVDRSTVRTWRRRWLAAAARLEAAAAAGDDRLLARLIAEALDDAPRAGAPPTFSAEQVVQIVALACEPPPGSDRPVSHWTPRELADEAVTRQIVPTISPRSVGRFLKRRPTAAPFEPLLVDLGAR